MAQTKKVSSTPTKTNSSSTATKKQPTAAEMREFQKEVLKKENLMVNKIIVDPPRSGLDSKTKEYLKTLKPEKIVYVSCNPITLARDIKELNHTYQFSKITFVDMFPNTDHVESVCLLVLKTKNMNGCE